MNRSKQVLAAIAAVVIVGAGGFWLYDSNQKTEEPAVNTEQTVQVQPVEDKPEITISEDQKTVSYEGKTGKSALELLNEKTEVTTEESSFGEFVTEINGVQADSSKEYWSFYVNGEYAAEGAGTYQTTDGEQIEWKLEQL